MGAGEILRETWRARSARERRALLACAGVVALVALYALLWEPGVSARRTLSASLPKMRAQIQDMRAQQKEILALRKTLPASAPTGDLRALLRASAERSPLQRSIDTIEWRSGERVLVAASAVRFETWIDWLHALQADLAVRVDTCRVQALEQPGMVRVEATFVRGAS